MATTQEMQKAVEIVLEAKRLRVRKRGHEALSGSEGVDSPAWMLAQYSELQGWLDAELAKLRPRHAQAVRKYLETGRKKDVVALGVSRTYFNKLLKRLDEKRSRVSR